MYLWSRRLAMGNLTNRNIPVNSTSLSTDSSRPDANGMKLFAVPLLT